MTEIRVRGVLFDMDGVLVRSEGSIERAWTAWAQRNGMPPAETIQAAHGRRSIDTVRALRPDLDADSENAFIENLEVTDNAGLEVLPGVRKLLNALPPAQWTVVTGASKKLAIARLKAGGVPIPERMITGDDVVNGKPDPSSYRQGAALLSLAPKDCLVVEDAPAGVASGKAAGCKVLAAADPKEWRMLMDADYRVESLEVISADVENGEITLRY
jgi:sugar-phosphatase